MFLLQKSQNEATNIIVLVIHPIVYYHSIPIVTHSITTRFPLRSHSNHWIEHVIAGIF